MDGEEGVKGKKERKEEMWRRGEKLGCGIKIDSEGD